MHTRHDTRVMTRSPQPNVGILPGNRATCPQTIGYRDVAASCNADDRTVADADNRARCANRQQPLLMTTASLAPPQVEGAGPLAGHGGPRILGGVSVAVPPTVTLERRFVGELAEMAFPWRAAEVIDPRLLVLNEPLATELGLEPAWLRSSDGLRLLVGNLVPSGATPVAVSYTHLRAHETD